MFWVWQLLATLYDSAEDRVALYCRAMLCKSPNDMLVKLWDEAAILFASQANYPLAKYLLRKAAEVRHAHQYRMSHAYTDACMQTWFRQTEGVWDKNYIQQQALRAEELVCQDLQAFPVLVTYINPDKQMVSFLTEDKQSGFFKIIKKADIPTIHTNDVIILRAEQIASSGPTKVASYQLSDDHTNAHFFRPFSAAIRKTASGVGFIEHIFVPQQLAEPFADGQTVQGTAVLNLDKKKNQWGWKAISINP